MYRPIIKIQWFCILIPTNQLWTLSFDQYGRVNWRHSSTHQMDWAMVLKTVWLIPCCWQIRASAGGMIQNLVVWMVQHVPKSLWSPQCLFPITNQYINWLGVFVHIYTLLFTKFARTEASFSIISMHTTWLQKFTCVLIIQNRNLELQCQWGQWKALWIMVSANLKVWMYIGNETGQFSHTGTIWKMVEKSKKAQEFLTQMVKFLCGNWVRLLQMQVSWKNL